MTAPIQNDESATLANSIPKRDLAYFEFKDDIEEFLHAEADALDERRFKEWLDMLSDDLVYFMPMRRNVKFGQHAQSENTRQGKEISWFDEDKWTLTKRVEQILTGVHWAEEPLSRTCHVVGNIRVREVRHDDAGVATAKVSSRFIVYQNRVEYETYFFVGRRTDHIRRAPDGSLKLARREILLDQSVLLAKNLTTFF